MNHKLKAEEKDLLLKDLCARLPYKVVCAFPNNLDGKFDIVEQLNPSSISLLMEGRTLIKPYLRPISSMTNEEAVNYHSIDTYSIRGDMVAKIDFYLKHHFDFRLTPERLSMIEAGLALEALEGMYEV